MDVTGPVDEYSIDLLLAAGCNLQIVDERNPIQRLRDCYVISRFIDDLHQIETPADMGFVS